MTKALAWHVAGTCWAARRLRNSPKRATTKPKAMIVRSGAYPRQQGAFGGEEDARVRHVQTGDVVAALRQVMVLLAVFIEPFMEGKRTTQTGGHAETAGHAGFLIVIAPRISPGR